MYLEHFVSFPPSIGWLWVKKGFRNSSRGLVWSLWHPFGTDLVCEIQIILDQWKFQVAVFRDCWYESTLFHITQHPSTSSATRTKVCVLGGLLSIPGLPHQHTLSKGWPQEAEFRSFGWSLLASLFSFPKHRLGEDIAGCFSALPTVPSSRISSDVSPPFQSL